MSEPTSQQLTFRDRLCVLVDSAQFNNTIIAVIVLNALVLGMQTSDRLVAQYGSVLDAVDNIFLTIFVIELGMRMVAYGAGFVRRPWSMFDLVVVGIALTPGAEAFSVMRALRILRALRLISQVPTMRVVVEALLKSLPGLGSTAILLMLIFMCAVSWRPCCSRLNSRNFRNVRWFDLQFIPSHDVGKLVNGYRSTGHGRIPVRLGILCAVCRVDLYSCVEPRGCCRRRQYAIREREYRIFRCSRVGDRYCYA